jgi:hypothetical protein
MNHRSPCAWAVALVVALLSGLVSPTSLRALPAGRQRSGGSIGGPAYALLAERALAHRQSFYVYQDADSGFNHGFPSGLFGAVDKIQVDTACVPDPMAPTGCSDDPDRLERERGTVLRISFEPLASGDYAGVNVEEPENWGTTRRGVGYDLRGASQVVLDLRSPTGIQVQLGLGGCTGEFLAVPPGPVFQRVRLPLVWPHCEPNLADTHLLFTVATNGSHAPGGGTLLVDSIRLEPLPQARRTTLGLPLSTETFGVVPRGHPAPGRVPFPPDQVMRNVATVYESALALMALLERGQAAGAESADGARLIADALVYALRHDNDGDPLPVAAGGWAGLHNAYSSGDIALHNSQGPGAGQAGQVRLAGFGCAVSPTGYCVVLDGATGGNNALVILALLAAHLRFADESYLAAAQNIGRWIADTLADRSGTGYGGYYVGYADEGIQPKELLRAKSTENNADIYAAFAALAALEEQRGNLPAAAEWEAQARAAGDFCLAMYDPVAGRFQAGTLPAGSAPGPGLCPDGPQRGEEVINTCDFLDSNTFTALALAASPHYREVIDWRRPIRYALQTFDVAVVAGGLEFEGFGLVPAPVAGPPGIAWEFTGQMVAAMRFLDRLYGHDEFEGEAAFYLDQIARAQHLAPFGDGRGLVAATLEQGDRLPPLEHCLSTPFQCIPQRVGLAATAWALFAEAGIQPFRPGSFRALLPLVVR